MAKKEAKEKKKKESLTEKDNTDKKEHSDCFLFDICNKFPLWQISTAVFVFVAIVLFILNALSGTSAGRMFIVVISYLFMIGVATFGSNLLFDLYKKQRVQKTAIYYVWTTLILSVFAIIFFIMIALKMTHGTNATHPTAGYFVAYNFWFFILFGIIFPIFCLSPLILTNLIVLKKIYKV